MDELGKAAAPLEQLLDDLARRVADVVVERLRGPAEADLVDQGASPLGNRRHINTVRRRMASGQPGASRVGRRYLLSRTALSEELAHAGGSSEKAPNGPPANTLRSDLEAELRLVRGGGSK